MSWMKARLDRTPPSERCRATQLQLRTRRLWKSPKVMMSRGDLRLERVKCMPPLSASNRLMSKVYSIETNSTPDDERLLKTCNQLRTLRNLSDLPSRLKRGKTASPEVRSRCILWRNSLTSRSDCDNTPRDQSVKHSDCGADGLFIDWTMFGRPAHYRALHAPSGIQC